MALEIRSRRFGFAVLDGGELLDWGVRYYPSGLSRIETALKSLAFVLRLYEPSIVVFRRPRAVGDESSRHASHVFAAVRHRLEERLIPYIIARRADVRESLARQGFHTKYDIACALAQRFSQLKGLLPSPRKTWEHERHVMVVFDAIATAIACETESTEPENLI